MQRLINVNRIAKKRIPMKCTYLIPKIKLEQSYFVADV